jgi:hypothetical protein
MQQISAVELTYMQHIIIHKFLQNVCRWKCNAYMLYVTACYLLQDMIQRKR